MADCERFEVAIEMEAHGALDASAAAELSSHLAGCEACRRYQALLRQTEKTMEAHAQTLDLNAIDARIGRLHRNLKLRTWLPIPIILLFAAAIVAASGKLA